MNTITVIIPVYNALDYISSCIEALSKQSYLGFRVVFVNDCSTDNTEALLMSYKGKTPFEFVVESLKVNSGSGVARNLGMQRSNTEYSAFIDVDDVISNNYFEELINEARMSSSDVVISAAYKKWDNGRKTPHYNIEKLEKIANDREMLISQLDIGPWGMLFKTSLWDKDCEFPSDIRAEDLASIPIIYTRAKSISFAREAIYYYRQTINSRSRAQGRFYNDIFLSFQILESRLKDSKLLEFYAARAIGYGVIMNALLNKKKFVLSYYTDYLKINYPKGYKNDYLKHLQWQKRVFIVCSYLKLFSVQSLMVKIAK